MIKYIATWSGLMFIFYLLVSFSLWQFNPALWRIVDRTILSVFGTLFSLALTALHYDTSKTSDIGPR